MTSTIFEGKLLVDLETGRVLRADDRVFVSERNIDAHPFVAEHENVIFAGPDAARRKLARQRGEGEDFLDAVEYEVYSRVAGIAELLRKES